MKKISLAILAIVLALAIGASAGVITHTGTISPTANPFESAFDVPLFNPSLGILESILVEFNTTTSGTISATNTGTEWDTFSIDGTEFAFLVWPDDSYTYAFSKPAHNYGSPAVAPGETKVYTVDSFLGSSSVTTSAAGDIALFTGTGNGTFVLDASYSYAWVATYGQPYSIDVDLNTGCNWTVEYNYIVPEPVTISLLAVGCLAILRRKSSKK